MGIFVSTGSLKGQGNVVFNGRGPVNGLSADKEQDAVKGQDPVKEQDPVVAQDRARLPFKRGSCPRVLFRCLVMNPPNRCLRDVQCPGAKKCCEGFCGKTCMDPGKVRKGWRKRRPVKGQRGRLAEGDPRLVGRGHGR